MRTRDTNKEEIVKQKTIEMIVKNGIEGFAMNRLAKECGISVATLYIYYTDKEDLIKKVGTELGTYFFKSSLKDCNKPIVLPKPSLKVRMDLYCLIFSDIRDCSLLSFAYWGVTFKLGFAKTKKAETKFI